MDTSNQPEKHTATWETPTLREIPISFEATSYSLADDEVVQR
jgi:coenzyme PQQ precursor peptide PqqA